MEVELKEIIEKIKADGIKTAEDKSAVILAEAERAAKQIIADAQKKSDAIIQNAAAEKDKFEKSGVEALKLAGRDLILNLESKITGLFDALIKNETSTALSSGILEEMIPELVKKWDRDALHDLTILLSKEDFSRLDAPLRSKLADELKRGMKIAPFSGVDAGFLIQEKNGSSYYNFSAEGIAEILSQHLTPRFAALLKGQSK